MNQQAIPSAPSLRTLGVTSCRTGEGVSTVAARLAATAASSAEYPVLLVDCNLSRPSVHQTLKLKRKPGLAESMQGTKSLESCVQSSSISNLSGMTIGDTSGNHLSSFDPAKLSHLVEEVKRRFHLVVFDLPEYPESDVDEAIKNCPADCIYWEEE